MRDSIVHRIWVGFIGLSIALEVLLIISWIIAHYKAIGNNPFWMQMLVDSMVLTIGFPSLFIILSSIIGPLTLEKKPKVALIRTGESIWHFTFDNDVFAYQLIESDRSRQAKEQRRREKQEQARRERKAQEPQIGTKNGLAIASLVLGILGSSFSILFGIAAVICGAYCQT